MRKEWGCEEVACECFGEVGVLYGVEGLRVWISGENYGNDAGDGGPVAGEEVKRAKVYRFFRAPPRCLRDGGGLIVQAHGSECTGPAASPSGRGVWALHEPFGLEFYGELVFRRIGRHVGDEEAVGFFFCEL